MNVLSIDLTDVVPYLGRGVLVVAHSLPLADSSAQRPSILCTTSALGFRRKSK